MHSLGSDHTHTRSDRDSYVTVNAGNIIRGREHNFHKHDERNNTNVVPYDYGSVMHYSASWSAQYI